MTRFAHFWADGPPVDFCLAPFGTGMFVGPMLAGAGITGGLAYANVTRYLSLAPGRYDVKLVPAGITGCAVTQAPFSTCVSMDLPVIAAGTANTIAVEGELNAGDAGGRNCSFEQYVDDTSVASGKAKLRFVHAYSGPDTFDVGVGGGALFTPLFKGVTRGNSASANGGYVETAPIANEELSLRSGRAELISVDAANLVPDVIATAFAIGKQGSLPQWLWCQDNVALGTSLTPCSFLGTTPLRVHARIAHLSPDAPPLDLCLTRAGTPFEGKPVAQGFLKAPLAYPQVTGYFNLPVRNYDLRVVLSTATDCSTPVVPDTLNFAIASGSPFTIGATGDWLVPSASTDPAFALKIWHDEVPPRGTGGLRFLHASPGTGAVDVGKDYGGTSTKLFGNVAFGRLPTGPTIDTNGYTLATRDGTWWMQATGTSTPLLAVTYGFQWPLSQTIFAIGNKTGDPAQALKFLWCTDQNSEPPPAYPQPTDELSYCQVLP
jgi:hypothetical protein